MSLSPSYAESPEYDMGEQNQEKYTDITAEYNFKKLLVCGIDGCVFLVTDSLKRKRSSSQSSLNTSEKALKLIPYSITTSDKIAEQNEMFAKLKKNKKCTSKHVEILCPEKVFLGQVSEDLLKKFKMPFQYNIFYLIH